MAGRAFRAQPTNRPSPSTVFFHPKTQLFHQDQALCIPQRWTRALHVREANTTAAHDPLSQLRGQATSCSDTHGVCLAVPRYRPWQGWQRLAALLPLGSWLVLAARSLISLSPLGEHEHVSAPTNAASERTSQLGAGAARARYLSWHRAAAPVKRGLEIHHYGFNARLKSLELALMPVKKTTGNLRSSRKEIFLIKPKGNGKDTSCPDGRSLPPSSNSSTPVLWQTTLFSLCM